MASNEPRSRVSVIIPTYNRPAYLRAAVESVLAQTFAAFELIVVDDGSSGETAAAMAAFTDPRVCYLYQENAGRSAARNRGMAAARGEFVALLDDDDLYLPHKLAAQVAFLDCHPDAGLVAGGTHMIDSGGTLLRVRECWREQPDLSLPACLEDCPLLPCTVLFRRNLLKKIDHWFDTEMEPAEDMDFWFRLLLAGCRMAWLPEIVSAYRQHTGSSQHDAERYHRAYLRLWEKIYTRADLPGGPRSERPAHFAHYNIDAACRAYAAGETGTGRQLLREAVALRPAILKGRPPPLILRLVTFAQGVQGLDPVATMEAVFDGLPRELSHMRSYRNQVLSTAHMRCVFAAHAAGARPRWRDWLLGVYHHPRWLANRGVWAILVRDIVLGTPPIGAR